MLYLIGLGLNEKSMSVEAIEALSKCSVVYLENYTADFPYNIENLENQLKIKNKIIKLGRKEIENESDKLVKEAKNKNTALLVYGSPLFATTHLSLINDCKKNKVKIKIIFNASVFDAVASCGLELYKFGKITSMPKWINENGKKYEPDSFMDIVKENLSIKAYTLILCDIGLSFKDAAEQLKKAANNKKLNLESRKIVVCSCLGSDNEKIFYGFTDEILKKFGEKIKNPFCIIIPGELHFMEREFLESL
jgi:diphthine synthase